MVFKYLVFLFFMLPSVVFAQLIPTTPDIVPRFEGTYSVKGDSITFELELENRGLAMAESKVLHSKILLIPKFDYQNKLVGQGVVLDTLHTPIQLGAGEAVTVSVEKRLPSLPKAEYFLAVTTNTSQQWDPSDGMSSHGKEGHHDGLKENTGVKEGLKEAVKEREELVIESLNGPVSSDSARPDFINEDVPSQVNNITEQMLDLGTLVNDAPRKTGHYDLYHEVESAHFDLSGKTAMHSSRTILRVMEGADEIPDDQQWNDDISARFCFFNLAEGKAYLGAYHENALDKVWGAISWRPELDPIGRYTYVDYYSNAPQVDHLSPGHYLLGVLMNVTDKFTLDSFPENNLDLTFLNLEEQSLLSTPAEVWFSVNSAKEASISSSISGRSDQHTWKYSVKDKPTWLKLQAANTGYQYTISLSVDKDMPIGVFEIPVRVEAEKDGEVVSAVSIVRVFKNDGPLLSFDNIKPNEIITKDDRRLKIVDENGIKSLHLEIKITNIGNRELIFSKGSLYPTSLTIDFPEKRLLAPGETTSVLLAYRLIGIAIPRPNSSSLSYVSLSIQSNAPSESLSFQFDLAGILNLEPENFVTPETEFLRLFQK